MSKPTAPSRPARDEELDGDLAALTPQQAVLLAEQAEAEAIAADAAAAVARERARASRLGCDPGPRGSGRRRRWPVVAGVVALLCAAAMLAASAYIVWGHQANVQDEQNRAEFTAAAKQVAVTLMSIDFNDPQGGVQRILDNSMDPFHVEFESAAEDFVKVAADAKVTTKATTTAAAVQSVTADSAVVLVAATSTVTDADGVAEPPRSWRLTVDLQRVGDRIKMSKVEFIP